MKLSPTFMVVAATAVLAGCGGSGSDAAPAPLGSPGNPVPARAADATVNEGAAPAKPGYAKLVQRQGRKPESRFTPCNLVTTAQARAIIGTPVAQPVEAPLGPTCIYRSRDRKAFVTLAVQAVGLSDAARQMRGRRSLKVSGRAAVCGRLDRPMLYVSLAPRRILAVAGPCAMARRFAATAVDRLHG